MSKPMTAFTTDFQHSGMVAKDLDETIAFYTEKLGFEVAGIFHNGENRCAFLRYGHLTIETWEGEPAPMTTGAINHWAFDTPDIEAAFENAKELGLKFKTPRSSTSTASGSTASASSTCTVRTARPSSSARSSDCSADKDEGRSHPQQRDGNAPRLCVCVCIRVFRAYANTYCACAVTLPCCRRP